MDIDLIGFKEDAIRNIENNLFLISSNLDWDTFYRKTSKLCDNFLIIATANIMIDSTPSNFLHNLCRVGENWRRLLYFANTHYEQRISFFKDYPLHAAVIVQQKNLITNLIKELPTQWEQGEEPQDRYYANHLLLALSNSRVIINNEIETLLLNLEACEKTGLRTKLIKALLLMEASTEDDFWKAFDQLLTAHQEWVQKKIDQRSYSIEAFLPHSILWFEGMAWLKLAQVKGFTLPNRELAMCPKEALLSMPEPYENDWVILSDSTF